MRQTIKKSLSRQPKGHRLRLLLFNMETKKWENRPISWHFHLPGRRQENIQGTLSASLTRQKNLDFQPLSRHILHSVCPLGCVERTRYNFSPKTLLARVATTAAQVIVFAPPVTVKKEAPFHLPFLTLTHKSRSLFFSFWGAGLSCGLLVLAAFSLSIMDDFSRFSLLSFSLEPLLMIPSIMP